MTQREWEKTFGGFSLLAFFCAFCTFVAIGALIPYESPQYLDTAHYHRGATVPSPHIMALSWLLIALIALGIVCANAWRGRRRMRIKAETYAEARERSYQRARALGRARDAQREKQRAEKWHAEVDAYAAAHPDEPF